MCIALTTDNYADVDAFVEVEYPTFGGKAGIVWNTFIASTSIGVGETVYACADTFFLNSPEDIRVSASDDWHGSIYYYALHTPGKKTKACFFVQRLSAICF